MSCQDDESMHFHIFWTPILGLTRVIDPVVVFFHRPSSLGYGYGVYDIRSHRIPSPHHRAVSQVAEPITYSNSQAFPALFHRKPSQATPLRRHVVAVIRKYTIYDSPQPSFPASSTCQTHNSAPRSYGQLPH
ncbi:hypothetical protein VE01_10778 [Pseudogymnoascus verrucosus]|uniref:Uncharacterized protein n=1 Tax=Pseudogymnoascus verrucosus TaxID=342668 RepID=A0A2P6FGV9_9PEZI|nr:uncharacterized protein VE01_10778 [Pseudogymnoascus verrucosus]PQM43882.1 hypothetical protein VE01_10778 [Pseudogymnoascus verrucosus]